MTNNLKNKKIALVTGAAGFLGRHCSKQLSLAGYYVIGLDINEFKDHANWTIHEFIHGPCSLETLVKIFEGKSELSLILHCAGTGSVSASFSGPLSDFQSNVVSTAELLEFCRLYKPDVPIAIPSSAAVYGDVNSTPLSENSHLNPISPYGFHKKMMEEIAFSFSKNFGLKIAIVRFFSIYGEGLRKQIIWDACQKAQRGQYHFSGTGYEIRDFIHVTDAARLLELAATKASSDFTIINGGSGQGVSIREVLTMIQLLWRKNLDLQFDNRVRPGDPAEYVADTTLLKIWGFSFSKDLQKEIENYIEWFLKNEKP
jgi:UDP-glucose 4-epimerase